MKKLINSIGIFALLSIFVFAACNQQGRNVQENLAEIREDMQDVIVRIDEALYAEDVSEFRNKADDALSKLDNRIDDFQDEMDRANQEIDRQTRERVVELKQRKVEIDFKLALLDDNGQRRDDGTWDADRTGERTDRRDVTYQDDQMGTADRRSGTMAVEEDDRGVAGDHRTDGRTQDRADGHTHDRGTADGRTGTGLGIGDRDHLDGEYYGEDLLGEIKEDLRELRREVEQFAQSI